MCHNRRVNERMFNPPPSGRDAAIVAEPSRLCSAALQSTFAGITARPIAGASLSSLSSFAFQYVNITHSREDFPRTARHPLNNIIARTQGRKAAWTGQTRLKFMCQLFAPLGLGAFALNSVWLRLAALCPSPNRPPSPKRLRFSPCQYR
jgi:hypothetical protein